jgi:hypothetical protein
MELLSARTLSRPSLKEDVGRSSIQTSGELAPRILAINLPYSSLERDFCRRRLARRKRPEDDISEQRPKFGDYRAREMAAKTAFVLAGFNIRVSEDWRTRARTWDPLIKGQMSASP